MPADCASISGLNWPVCPAPDWPTRFVGRPYAPDGRGPDKYDCYGLLIAGARCFGVEITDCPPPPDADPLARAVHAEHVLKSAARTWVQVPFPAAGEAVLFKRPRQPHHVGICVDGLDVLHACELAGQVVRERLADHPATIVGFFAPAEVVR